MLLFFFFFFYFLTLETSLSIFFLVFPSYFYSVRAAKVLCARILQCPCSARPVCVFVPASYIMILTERTLKKGHEGDKRKEEEDALTCRRRRFALAPLFKPDEEWRAVADQVCAQHAQDGHRRETRSKPKKSIRHNKHGAKSQRGWGKVMDHLRYI